MRLSTLMHLRDMPNNVVHWAAQFGDDIGRGVEQCSDIETYCAMVSALHLAGECDLRAMASALSSIHPPIIEFVMPGFRQEVSAILRAGSFHGLTRVHSMTAATELFGVLLRSRTNGVTPHEIALTALGDGLLCIGHPGRSERASLFGASMLRAVECGIDTSVVLNAMHLWLDDALSTGWRNLEKSR